VLLLFHGHHPLGRSVSVMGVMGTVVVVFLGGETSLEALGR
jgi:hypothetical protein